MKKKTNLQKRLEDPNSSLWRRKADKLWKELIYLNWNKKCAICQSDQWVQAHHLIPREMYSHRHTPSNGIALCAKHHRYSFELSAHKAPVSFFKWIKESNPELLDWLLNQNPNRKNEMTFKDIASNLEGKKNNIKPLEIIEAKPGE